MKTKSITSELIQELLSEKVTPCVSIYMSTHRSHPENVQDTIRYKKSHKTSEGIFRRKISNNRSSKIIEAF